MSRRVVSIVIGGALLAMATALPAAADPRGFGPISIDCGSAGSYETVVNGNGDWTPAHDLASTSVLIPVAFDEETFTYTDPDGYTYPTEGPGTLRVKGNARKVAGAVECEFEFDIFTGNGDEEFAGSGIVWGYITPRS